MAPRARGKGRAGRASGGSRASARQAKQNAKTDIPDVFREMLAETGPAPEDDEARPRKRPRRAGERVQTVQVKEEEEEEKEVQDSSPVPELLVQTVLDDEHDSESDLEFEDIEVGADEDIEPEISQPTDVPSEGFAVTAKRSEESKSRRSVRRRKPATSAEKSMRLDVHKMHVMYLLYHCFYRNNWCNDEIAQAMLKQTVSPRIITLLNPDPTHTQAQSSRLFLEGLLQICDFWHARFSITSYGLKRPQWLADKDELANVQLHEKIEKPLELADFRRAVQSLQGSADLGAQLFCCLLRSVGVETRLVCSLQVLGFASASEVNISTNNTPVKKTYYAEELEEATETPPSSTVNVGTTSAPRRIARIGQPRRGNEQQDLGRPPSNLSEKPKRIERPSYPVYWVEAFNTAHQKWVAVDPLATRTVNKPSRLEPGLNDSRNGLSYVMAFEENGVARDVTRRYTKAYVAKTRRLRVENTENGIIWLRKALKLFKRPRALDRDQVEDAELLAREAAEGMPGNIQDFRNHPHYALERHLRRNEVIHPRRESGRVNVGTANHPKFEAVYRRRDVHLVKSADRWFRLGREIKIGEQPLKHAVPRRRATSEDGEEDIGVGLYAAFQTRIYLPPKVVDGRLPKNMYGNIDVYTPSMIPEGAVWIRMPEAKHAAKLLRIDYADAVTGFNFRGRHGTAVTDGVIVAEEHFEAMEIAIEGIRQGISDDMEQQRVKEALRLWKRYLVGMRVVKRIEGYGGDEQEIEERRIEENELRKQIDVEMQDYAQEEDGGGFVVDEAVQVATPTVRRSHRNKDDGGFLADADSEVAVSEGEDEDFNSGGGFLPDSDSEDAYKSGSDLSSEHDENEKRLADFSIDSQKKPIRAANSLADPLGMDKASSRSTFGFENIKVPNHLWQTMPSDGDLVARLPSVIKGVRCPGSVPDVLEDLHVAKDNLEEDQIPQQVAATSAPPRNSISVSPDAMQVYNAPSNQDDMLVPSTPSPEPDLKQETPTMAALVPKNMVDEDAPASSYEYDDDMLLEDPEDEDAEPEWVA